MTQPFIFYKQTQSEVEVAGAEGAAHPADREDLNLETQEFPIYPAPSFSKSEAGRQGIRKCANLTNGSPLYADTPQTLPTLSHHQLDTGLPPPPVMCFCLGFNFQTQ